MSTGFIDWTETGLTLFVFEKNGAKYALIDTLSVSLDGEPGPSTLAPFKKVGMRNVYLSLPLDLLTLREQTFPFDDPDKIRNTIAFELEGILIGSTEEYSIDHIVIESINSSSNVLAVCLEKKKLKDIIEIFSSAGLDPKVVTSLDVCISEGKTDGLFEEKISDPETRTEAAAKELRKPSINLRQEEMLYTGDIKRFRKKLRFTAFLVLILVTILGLNISITLMAEREKQKTLSTETERAYRTIFPEDRKIVDIERQLIGNIKKLEQKKAALIGIPVLDLLRTIAERNKNSITLNEFNTDGKNIIIKGTADSFEDVDSFKDNLSQTFNGTKVMDSNAGADKKIGFTIIMQEKRA
ncbi:MAG TPA: hypothetical protein ENH18_03785 [Nitrospirae bacterium]|nr:GspL periplasmic domain protein [bacterium BMS3Bbin09]HDN95267.1 hypothetical protein [Nitrospirota bacterium]HDO67299.1 hypothetical protein [Nitrospirota bacterium]HEW81473.1 hypothetical protein [Nitrospirota bacterium]